MKKVDFDDELPISEHLEELRYRAIYVAAAMAIGFLLSYSIKDLIFAILQRPLPEEYKKLTFLSPTEAFMTVIKVSFFSGIILSAPMTFYQGWCFACPALLKKEKAYLYTTAIWSSLFFLAGVLFAYFVVMPIGLSFLLHYGERFGTPAITISNYISFTIKFILGFGIIFELPLVAALLTKFGLITQHTLKKNRGASIVIIFIVSALLTPPDVATQILMSIPLLILFEVSIKAAAYFEKRD